jgi:hypothetical protein
MAAYACPAPASRFRPRQRPASFPTAQPTGILPGMSNQPRSQAGPPMTLGNMRANGVRSLDVCCWLCHVRAILSADPWSDHVPVPSFGPRMVLHVTEASLNTQPTIPPSANILTRLNAAIVPTAVLLGTVTGIVKSLAAIGANAPSRSRH